MTVEIDIFQMMMMMMRHKRKDKLHFVPNLTGYDWQLIKLKTRCYKLDFEVV